jgi:cyclopropane fatty-acyl-phospholipid synthase-like methyltransferase
LRLRLPDRYDLVWSAGLFDYFTDRGFAALLQRLLSFCKSGHGQLVVGNFTDPNPSAAYQAFGDWSLEHRSRELLLRLARDCDGAAEPMYVGSEPEGVNLFLHVARA